MREVSAVARDAPRWSGPRWQASVRFRLALWHTLTLAVLLTAFAIGAYLFVVRTMRARLDRSLVDTAEVLVQAWADERGEGGASAAESARNVIAEVRSPALRTLVYGPDGALLAISDSARFTPDLSYAALRDASSSPLRVLTRRAASGPALVTIGRDDAWIRALARRVTVGGLPYTVVVMHRLDAEVEAGEVFATWLLGAILVALLGAGAGGYLLARATLAPIVAMASEAEQIGASRLDARLGVGNPHDELGLLAGVLNRLLERLERSFAQQRRFMADASHELRTPVAIVRTAADVALDQEGDDPAPLRETLRIVSAEGRRMSRLVDDLFLLARADGGQQPVRRSTLYLEEILAEAASGGRFLARARGATVVANSAVESPFPGDAALLGRLMLNLVDNAVRHSPRGGVVRLSLTRRRDTVLPDGTVLAGNWYRLAVEDEGPGVPGPLRDRLFDRFVRGDPVREDGDRAAAGGAGLGLSIARWIAEAHAGHVVLERGDAGHTCFAAWLPAGLLMPAT